MLCNIVSLIMLCNIVSLIMLCNIVSLIMLCNIVSLIMLCNNVSLIMLCNIVSLIMLCNIVSLIMLCNIVSLIMLCNNCSLIMLTAVNVQLHWRDLWFSQGQVTQCSYWNVIYVMSHDFQQLQWEYIYMYLKVNRNFEEKKMTICFPVYFPFLLQNINSLTTKQSNEGNQ